MSKRTIAVLGYVIVLALAATAVGQVAIQTGTLIPAAIPMAVISIAGLHFLRPDEELAGWVVFTAALAGAYLVFPAALGETHLDGVAPFEFAGALGIVTLAGLGAWRWPWILAATWFGHILWDFVPRELPELMLDVPMACILYDGLIGFYLAWGVVRGRWRSFGGRVKTAATVPST
jgi:hypothetical protein